MIKRVKLKTKGMYENSDKTDPDYGLWKQIADYMDGEEAIVCTGSEPESYVFLGLTDKKKEKELIWMMEQDSVCGRFIGDREEFDKVWDDGEYDSELIFSLEREFVEMK